MADQNIIVMVDWRGVFPAMTTKFDAQNALDLAMFEHSLKAQMSAGVHGIILGGTLGEASTLSPDEKELLVKTSLEVTQGQLPVILNIAEGSTTEAIHQVNLAKKWGAHGLMVLPPMRYKPDHRECVAYFASIAKSTDLPIMIYNNPVDYKTEVTISMMEELLAYPNIQAVKESTRDITNVTKLKTLFGARLKVLCGVDTLAMEALVMGADGWVAGLVCAYPRETVYLYQLILSGKLTEAVELYRWFMPLLELDLHPKLVQYIKLAETIEGIGSEYVRPPRLSLVGDERERILHLIQEANKMKSDLLKV